MDIARVLAVAAQVSGVEIVGQFRAFRFCLHIDMNAPAAIYVIALLEIRVINMYIPAFYIQNRVAHVDNIRLLQAHNAAVYYN
jgi:hypothetical protein